MKSGHLFVQQPRKKGKGLRRSFELLLLHSKTKLNQIQQNTRINLNLAIQITK